MKLFTTSTLALACLLAPSTPSLVGQSTPTPTIVIHHPATISHEPGPATHFAGTVTIDMLTVPEEANLTRTETITFAPGGHTNWHSHPHGQILVVTSGSGVIQQRGGPVQHIKQGDVIWTPPNVQHWHGATPGGPMVHISIYQEPAGEVTKWLEPVPDAQYSAASK